MDIQLKYNYLVHDIDQWTYRLAKIRIADDEIRNEAQSSNISTDITFYRRKIEEAIARLMVILAGRITKTGTTANSDLNTSKTTWTFAFNGSIYYTSLQAIANIMHKYVVRSVIVDWARTYAPEAIASLEAELEQLKQDVITESFRRKSPVIDETLTSNVTAVGESESGSSSDDDDDTTTGDVQQTESTSRPSQTMRPGIGSGTQVDATDDVDIYSKFPTIINPTN